MPDFPEIVTERLLLRNFQSSDIDSVFEIFSDDQVTEFYDVATFTELAQAERMVNHYLDLKAQGGEYGFRWAIVLQGQTEKVIGSCGFHSTSKLYHSIEIGYELHPKFWKNGYGLEAVFAMISYCFNKDFPFPLNRIAAKTNLESLRSMTLLRRLGFQEEGVLREFGYWKSRFQDLRLFSLLRREFVAESPRERIGREENHES